MQIHILIGKNINDKTHASFLRPGREPLHCQGGIREMVQCHTDTDEVEVEKFRSGEGFGHGLPREVSLLGVHFLGGDTGVRSEIVVLGNHPIGDV